MQEKFHHSLNVQFNTVVPNHVQLDAKVIKNFITRNNMNVNLDQTQDHDLTRVLKIACGGNHTLAMTA